MYEGFALAWTPDLAAFESVECQPDSSDGMFVSDPATPVIGFYTNPCSPQLHHCHDTV